MLETSSSSGTATDACMKTPGRQKRARLESLARMEIDYRARISFLHATTQVMKPVPIDTLLDHLPVFARYLEHIKERFADVPAIMLPLREIGAILNCTMAALDESPEALDVRNAVGTWMKKHDFSDDWIADAALSTLNEHASGRAERRSWYLLVDPDQTQPLLSMALRKRADETLKQFCNRADREYRKKKKEYVKICQFRMGSRKGELEPAKWTALVFAGATIAQVARDVNLDDDLVRKAVTTFKKRAKLQKLVFRGPEEMPKER